MRLLLVEDEERLARAVRRVLESERYQVDHADNGADAVTMGQQSDYDVIVLDVMLPIMTGIQVCRVLRESGVKTPILMLTALGEVEDKVAGLDVGADDYLVKPFAFDELLARLRALLRRRPEVSQETSLIVADLELDLTKHRAMRGDIEVELTATEFRLLELLMRHVGQVVSRVRILERVWGYTYDGQASVVDTYVHYLRAKIEPEGAAPLIRTVRGVGYTMMEG
ncbi:MAG: response regulator transcription factor [SAR202 cluster bacterium]|jgi:DNA-binding response OmpR family regulator|nr:response regulator transcription factor [SAR202 cluster bacterium]MDP6512126.1 response regulator transcription factor [SAR202 cluster bacterium]MDP6715839.1 response regulator transcription factor [SAR202 cluster bacterium]